MARLVMKSPYLKPNKQASVKRYVKYIATRDGVEFVDNSKAHLPATVEQQRFINKLLKEFPDGIELHEYQDYSEKPTRRNASEFISTLIESQSDLFESREKYVSYIAERPRVEKLGRHGLFSDQGAVVNLEEVQREVAESNSNVWTHIISLTREDAERLGYNNANAWMTLLRAHRNDFAKAMRINPDDFRWYAAFHNEAHHPHVHMIAYSVGDKKPYLDKNGIEKIKSALASDIFKDERISIYQEQTETRDEIKSKAHAIVADFIKEMNSGVMDNPRIQMLLNALAEKLKTHKGKKVYGYLKSDAKNIVNTIVDELEKEESIKSLYDMWYERKREIQTFYTDTPPKRVPLSENNTFKPIKNMIIQEATFLIADDEAEELFKKEKEQRKWTEYKKGKQYLDANSDAYDFEEGIYWLKQSAEHGNSFAEYMLGRIYLFGLGTDKDFDLAISYLVSSASKGNEYAEQLLQATQQNRYALAAPSGMSLITSIAYAIQESINEQERKKMQMQHVRDSADKKEREKTNEKKRAHGQKIEM